MSDLNDINRAIGSLEAQVQNLTVAVTALTATVQSLQQSKWTARGVLAGLTLAGGAVGGKIADLFNSGQG
jgi:prefoldin subunit 5